MKDYILKTNLSHVLHKVDTSKHVHKPFDDVLKFVGWGRKATQGKMRYGTNLINFMGKPMELLPNATLHRQNEACMKHTAQ